MIKFTGSKKHESWTLLVIKLPQHVSFDNYDVNASSLASLSHKPHVIFQTRNIVITSFTSVQRHYELNDKTLEVIKMKLTSSM